MVLDYWSKMENILIVDDSKTITKTLEKLISESLDLNPIIAYSKKECEEKILEFNDNISVALLDLGLPDAPNGEVIDLVAKYAIPSIVLTGSEDKHHLLKEKKIVDYVIKEGGFSYEYILNLIKRIINNRGVEVIVAEDSMSTALQMINLLKRYQLKCLHAKDGIEALELLKRNTNVKIVFTDFDMPNMDGLTLTKEIRKEYSKDNVSIVAVTGHKDSAIIAKFLKYGANDFLYKGYSEEEFFARLNENLETQELFQALKDKANKDYMTGMFNRRYFFDEGETLYKEAKNSGKNICVAMFDIDKFKNINDTYGHDIGDIAIIEVAKVVNKYFPKEAIISRFGGEEFCVIQVDIGEDIFVKTLEIIRKEFETNIINTPKGDIKYTVSTGYTITTGGCLDDMVNRSDEGLYKAKNGGRNQVQKA